MLGVRLAIYTLRSTWPNWFCGSSPMGIGCFAQKTGCGCALAEPSSVLFCNGAFANAGSLLLGLEILK